MPEGDTIHRSAARLRPALEGRRIERFEAPRLLGAQPVPGTLITGVEAVGKFLLVHFGEPGPPRTLETHMKMTGSWHLYRHGEKWQRPRRQLRVRIDADSGWTAVCFAAPHVRMLSPGGARSGHGHLGPDLTGPDPDLADAADRFSRFGDGERPIGVAMLDQRICCGVGNVYKSEVLHAEGVDPRTPVAGSMNRIDRTCELCGARKMTRGEGVRIVDGGRTGPDRHETASTHESPMN